MTMKTAMTRFAAMCGLAAVLVTVAMVESASGQSDKSATPPTVKADGLEVTLLSFKRSPSRAVSLGGNCPPGGAVATAQGVLNEGRVLLTAKVKIKVSPTYKPEKDAKVFLLDDHDEKTETVTSLGGFGNPGRETEYECTFQFVGSEKARYLILQIVSAKLDLESKPK